MKNIIQEIKSTLSSFGKTPSDQKKQSTSSVNWFSKKMQTLKNITKGQINPEKQNIKKQIISDSGSSKTFKYKKSGYIYFFNYKPPNTKDVEFYDEFPLVLSLGVIGTTMVGINLHYLPIKIRLYLVYKIVKSMTEDAKEGTRIKIQTLLTSRTVRKYIMILGEEYQISAIKSKVKLVTPDEFLVMSFLPVQKFKKKQQSYITQKIKRLVRGMK